MKINITVGDTYFKCRLKFFQTAFLYLPAFLCLNARIRLIK